MKEKNKSVEELRDNVKKTMERIERRLEEAAPITTKKRNNLQNDTFAFPKQRKMPLDSCGRVRNAMARFSQVQGVSESEKRTAYRKIIRAANKCGIDASGFKDKYGGRYG